MTGKARNGFELLFLAMPKSRLGQSIAASAEVAQVEGTGKRNNGLQLLLQV
jgi:hypothetical protein